MSTQSGTWSSEFAMPYKVYIASLAQAATAAPVATVSENSIGAIVWARTGVGVYTATLAGAFTASKTYFLSTSTNSVITGVRTSANVLTFTNSVDAVPQDVFTGSVMIVVKQ